MQSQLPQLSEDLLDSEIKLKQLIRQCEEALSLTSESKELFLLLTKLHFATNSYRSQVEQLTRELEAWSSSQGDGPQSCLKF